MLKLNISVTIVPVRSDRAGRRLVLGGGLPQQRGGLGQLRQLWRCEWVYILDAAELTLPFLRTVLHRSWVSRLDHSFHPALNIHSSFFECFWILRFRFAFGFLFTIAKLRSQINRSRHDVQMSVGFKMSLNDICFSFYCTLAFRHVKIQWVN